MPMIAACARGQGGTCRVFPAAAPEPGLWACYECGRTVDPRGPFGVRRSFVFHAPCLDTYNDRLAPQRSIPLDPPAPFMGFRWIKDQPRDATTPTTPPPTGHDPMP